MHKTLLILGLFLYFFNNILKDDTIKDMDEVQKKYDLMKNKLIYNELNYDNNFKISKCENKEIKIKLNDLHQKYVNLEDKLVNNDVKNHEINQINEKISTSKLKFIYNELDNEKETLVQLKSKYNLLFEELENQNKKYDNLYQMFCSHQNYTQQNYLHKNNQDCSFYNEDECDSYINHKYHSYSLDQSEDYYQNKNFINNLKKNMEKLKDENCKLKINEEENKKKYQKLKDDLNNEEKKYEKLNMLYEESLKKLEKKKNITKKMLDHINQILKENKNLKKKLKMY